MQDWYAAIWEYTIFWTFLGMDLYGKKLVADACKFAVLVANVWFFFVKKNAFWKCFDNLLKTFSKGESGIRTQQQRRFTIEVLLIQYMAGVFLMPGAHVQFQFWFMALLPLLLSMIGLPAVATVGVPLFFYPIIEPHLRTSEIMLAAHHIFMLAVIAWLLIVGPREDLLGYQKKLKQ